MGWRDLLQTGHEIIVSPWVGGRSLRTCTRSWTIEGTLPSEYGWHSFRASARKASWLAASDEASVVAPRSIVRGYLVGDRLIEDEVRVDPVPAKLSRQSERVYFVEDGLDRFVRISAGRVYEGGPLVYQGQDLPLGPEDDVLAAFLDRAKTVSSIANVPPALDAAFRVESWHRTQTERLRREEQERHEREERKRRMVERLGDATSRRQLARRDFAEAARAALAVGEAEYLDHRRGNRGASEVAIRFRLGGRRFECTCHEHSLAIIDAGICLTDERTGERGDGWLTLESLPGVIRQAEREDVLVVFRHVG